MGKENGIEVYFEKENIWTFDDEVTAFSEKLWCGLLIYATAYPDGRLTFTFKNGSTFEG